METEKKIMEEQKKSSWDNRDVVEGIMSYLIDKARFFLNERKNNDIRVAKVITDCCDELRGILRWEELTKSKNKLSEK